MKPFAAVLLISALAVSACSDGMGYNGGRNTGATAGITDEGNPSDPKSIAYFKTSVGDRVLFDVDSSSLSPQGRDTAAGQADWLVQNSDYSVTIEGHADERGTREYNLALGARRANALREELIAAGVSADRLQTVSFGKERPVEICSDESCYSQNRRAVMVLGAR